MKVDIINSLPMQWEKGYMAAFPDARWYTTPPSRTDADVSVYMWCDADTMLAVNRSTHKNNIVFIRRYEWYSGFWRNIDWSKVSDVVMVNDYLAADFEKATGIKPHVIYNGVSINSWRFRDRKPGKHIAWVGYLNQKKNIPLALQIMAALPDDYELHIAGGVQDAQVWDYMENAAKAMRVKVVYNGKIPHEAMDSWLEDKSYLLSTAISEGNPNNVIEAMAKGIKPVVHNWPGAIDQFYPYTFNTVDEAVKMITEDQYDSGEYRRVVDDSYGPENYRKLVEIVEGLWTSLSV